jgi:hypothetical protein
MAKRASQPHRALPDYSPEVEANRENYRQIGAHLRDLCNFQYKHDALDIPPPGVLVDEHEPGILWHAIMQHLAALFDDIQNNHSDDFWTTLYVELRLYYDQQLFSLKTKGGASDDEKEI